MNSKKSLFGDTKVENGKKVPMVKNKKRKGGERVKEKEKKGRRPSISHVPLAASRSRLLLKAAVSLLSEGLSSFLCLVRFLLSEIT